MKDLVVEKRMLSDTIPAELPLLLEDAVRGGASIGFMENPPQEEVLAYWSRVRAEVMAGTKSIWVAREGDTGRIVGSVQLAYESKANGRHRAEVQKLMVMRSHRGQGLGSRLMAALEAEAKDRGVSLLVLDTSEGPGGAQKFYETGGYTYCGGVPNYALDPDGTPVKNAIYCKLLTTGRP